MAQMARLRIKITNGTLRVQGSGHLGRGTRPGFRRGPEGARTLEPQIEASESLAASKPDGIHSARTDVYECTESKGTRTYQAAGLPTCRWQGTSSAAQGPRYGPPYR